ncbi:MAG: N-acetyltransferase [Chloroflexi bacterium]|nr:N-acetyltransferase [Chloroflexota bacterium]
MNANISTGNETPVILRPVNGGNWRDITKLKVTEAQREFVAEPCYYLALCCYGDDWRPLAIYLDERAIAMLAEEHGYQHFALSYRPNNSAKHLYRMLGFIEADEWEDDEVVARLSLVGKGTDNTENTMRP